MTKILCLIVAMAMLMLPLPASAVSKDGLSLTIIHNEAPVREIDGQVALPFDDEYQIRLSNTHNRRAVAKVYIDGAPVSKIGDFVVPSNGTVDLERFLDSSLTEGKRFKFVRLSHPEVDDPDRKQNGLVRVEFKMELAHYVIFPDGEKWFYIPDTEWGQYDIPVNSYIHSTGVTNMTTDTSTSVETSATSSTEPGATIAGSQSYQTFHKVDVDTEDEVIAMEIRLVGISDLSLKGGD